MSSNLKILIIGSGFIAEHYLKVISSNNIECVVVGRGQKNIKKLSEIFNNIKFHSGGLENFLKQNSIEQFTHFINLVNIEYCIPITQVLLNHGAKKILLEKPGGLSINELTSIKDSANNVNAVIVIGYNRRFFESVNKLIELSNADGGIENIHFEFTEWVHKIDKDDYSVKALDKWILSNSSHVIDTVFYLIGLPKEITTKTLGVNKIDWHKSGSIFVGSGVSTNEILFSYNTNWNSAGRWAIEITTNSKRYYLKPMEKLLVQKKGQINITDIELPNDKDFNFKPGIYDLIHSFLNDDYSKLLSLEQQIEHIKIYNQIGDY
jgi:predicted dehydrogenase